MPQTLSAKGLFRRGPDEADAARYRAEARRRRLVEPYIDGRLLEIGCGHGGLADLCSPKNYLGVDDDPGHVLTAKSRAPTHEFALALPAPQRQFDTVVVHEKLQSVDSHRAALERWAGHLRPGGHMVVTLPFAPLALWTPAGQRAIAPITRAYMHDVARGAGMTLVSERTMLREGVKLFVLRLDRPAAALTGSEGAARSARP